MKTRKINLTGDYAELLDIGCHNAKIRICGESSRGGRYEVIVDLGDFYFAGLARETREHFQKLRAAEQRHAAWREEPFKP